MSNVNTNAAMSKTWLDKYSADQRSLLLDDIARFAASSSSNSKSGGGYMGLLPWKYGNGGLIPIKFLTHHKGRGSHFDRTIFSFIEVPQQKK